MPCARLPVLSLLPVLALLSLARLLARLLSIAVLVAALQRIRLPALAGLAALALLALRELLHPAAHGFQASQAFSRSPLSPPGPCPGLPLLLVGGLRLLQLIAQIVQPERDAVLAHPGR